MEKGADVRRRPRSVSRRAGGARSRRGPPGTGVLLDFRILPPIRASPPSRPARCPHPETHPAMSELWRRCLSRLEAEFSAEDLHTYLAPLQVSEEESGFTLWAPNAYTMETVRERFLAPIVEVL